MKYSKPIKFQNGLNKYMKLPLQQADTKRDDYSQQINYKNGLYKHMKNIYFIFFCIFFCSSAFAKVYDLGDITVYGKQDKKQDIIQKDIITEEDVEKTNSRTVSDVLNYASGIIVTKGSKNEAEIRVHGLGQDKISIFIDGIPYYETKYGKFNLDQIPAEIISEIVVEKGGSSVLYGSGGAVAVINIITKDADSKKLFFKGDVEFGENNTNNINLSLNKSFEKFKYWLNVNHKESDGWEMSDDYVAKEGTYGDKSTSTSAILEDGGLRNNSDYKSNSIWTRVGFMPNETNEFFLSLNYLKSERGMAPDVNFVKVDKTKYYYSRFARSENYKKMGIDLSGKHDISEAFVLKEKIFYHTHKDDYLSYDTPDYSNLFVTSTYNDSLIGFSILPELYLSSKHNLNFALHYKEDTHKERNKKTAPFETDKSNTSSLGAEYNFFPSEKLKTTVGVSYDNFKVTKTSAAKEKRKIDSLNPMVGVNYKISDKYSVFTSVAKKTKFPTLKELNGTGGENLNEEIITNYTVGSNINLSENIKFNFALFYHDLKDRIIKLDKEYKNEGKEVVKGYEIGTSLVSSDSLKFNLSFVYNDAENKSVGRTTDKMLGIPDKQLKIGVEYIVPKVELKLNFNSTYTGKQYDEDSNNYKLQTLDSYWLHDFRISKDFNKNTNAYISVSNILDENYEGEYGFPGQGRAVFVGLSYKY